MQDSAPRTVTATRETRGESGTNTTQGEGVRALYTWTKRGFKGREDGWGQTPHHTFTQPTNHTHTEDRTTHTRTNALFMLAFVVMPRLSLILPRVA